MMKITDVLLALLVAFIWGFNFVVIEVGLGKFPPFLFSALRFTCAAFPAVLLVRREGIQWKWIIIIGFIFGVILYGLLFIGMYVGMPAGLSSLVLQIQAVFTLFLSYMILHDPPTRWQKIGIALSILGIGILALGKYHTATFLGLIMVVSAGFTWAVTNILIKLSGQLDMFRFTVWICIIPPVPLFCLSLIFERNQISAIRNMSWIGAGAVLYTGIVATILAFGIWAKLLRDYSANTVAPFSLLIPIFGILSSVVLLSEKFTLNEIAASVIVFIGLFLVIFASRLSKLVMHNRISK